MWQTQPTTIQDVCTPSHFLPGGSVEPFSQWPLCGTGSLATCHGSVGTHAPGIRRSRALWLALKPSETAARPRQAMRHRWLWLMVPWARQSYSKSPVIPVKYSEIVKLVFFSQIYLLAKTNAVKDSISQTASAYLSVSFHCWLFHKHRGIARYCIGFTWGGILQTYIWSMGLLALLSENPRVEFESQHRRTCRHFAILRSRMVRLLRPFWLLDRVLNMTEFI